MSISDVKLVISIAIEIMEMKVFGNILSPLDIHQASSKFPSTLALQKQKNCYYFCSHFLLAAILIVTSLFYLI